MKSSKSLSPGSKWGELPIRELHKQEVITPDIIENVWRQVLEDSDARTSDYTESIDITMPVGNIHVLNTINYHQQIRAMEDGEILNSLTSIKDESECEESKNPFWFLSPRLRRNHQNSFKRNHSTVELRPSTARILLKHAIMSLVAHIGYEKASDLAIDTLIDVVDFFFKKFIAILKLASEQDDYYFPDAVERALLELGVGGVEELHNYYQNKILNFEKYMKKQAERMSQEQKQENGACSTKMETENITNRLHFKDFDEFGNVYGKEVPTLNLLDPDMGFPPSLDAGFQMLHSLEQDELNSMEIECEDVIVGDSPGIHNRTDVTSEKKKI